MERKSFTKKSIDHSDMGKFSFSFFCDRCGREWVSETKPFSGGGCTSVTNYDALKLLWANEHRTAFDEANLEARLKFNTCTVCGSKVCDDCFCFGEGSKDDVCVECC